MEILFHDECMCAVKDDTCSVPLTVQMYDNIKHLRKQMT